MKFWSRERGYAANLILAGTEEVGAGAVDPSSPDAGAGACVTCNLTPPCERARASSILLFKLRREISYRLIA